MCLFIYVRTYSFRQNGIRLCIYMYVCAPEEQGTTARSRDTRAPVTAAGLAAHAVARCVYGGVVSVCVCVYVCVCVRAYMHVRVYAFSVAGTYLVSVRHRCEIQFGSPVRVCP